MKIEPIKQRDGSACGPTSIEMAVKYFDLPITVKQIADISGYKKAGGLYNDQLIETLKKLDFNVTEHHNTSWDDFKKLNTKENVLIVAWMLKGYIGHFSVVDKVTDTHVFLADPEEGKIIKMQKLIFLRLWFDFDPLWYPEKNSDIHLRWVATVSKK